MNGSHQKNNSTKICLLSSRSSLQETMNAMLQRTKKS
jgi:hypothetical protein